MSALLNITAIDFNILLSILLFSIGVTGFLIRRNGLVALMCLELMLNGVNLLLITFSRVHGNPDGSSLYLLVILVAAVEAAVGLSLFVGLFRKVSSVNLDDFNRLRG